MNNVGRDQIWFNFDRLSNVKNVKSNVTVCFSNVNKECFCLFLGFSFYLLSENKHVCIFNAKTKTHLSYMLRHNGCAFETWNLNTKKSIGLVKVHSRILYMGRKFRNSQQRKKKLKTKKNLNKNSADLMKSERGVARAGETNDLNLILFWFNQAVSFLHGVYISRSSEPARVKRRTNLYFSLQWNVHYM